MRLISFLLALAACSAPITPPPPDAGPDTRCGIDCAAQQTYGLIVNRCFEYSKSAAGVTPADLGVLVLPVETLEGGLKVLPVEYRQGGQIPMRDSFALVNGSLVLARRSLPIGYSVTYKDAQMNIVGATWVKADTLVNQNFTSSVTADVIKGTRASDATTYRVTSAAPSGTELAVPAQTYPEGLKLVLSESPNHGADPRRVLVRGTGFVLFSSYFALDAAGTAQEYRLQKVRDIGTADAGTEECGFGTF